MPTTISFPNMFEPSSGKVMTVSGELSARQSLKSSLLTNIGELLGDPVFGSNLKSVMFDLKSSLMQKLLRDAIAETALKHVPQLQIVSTDINVTPDGSNLSAVVNYYTIDTGETNFIELVALPDGTLTTK